MRVCKDLALIFGTLVMASYVSRINSQFDITLSPVLPASVSSWTVKTLTVTIFASFTTFSMVYGQRKKILLVLHLRLARNARMRAVDMASADPKQFASV